MICTTFLERISASVFFRARARRVQRHFRLLQRSKMAAVVDRVDGCVGSLVPDAVSLLQSVPLPDQNNPLLGLPIVAIETILSFLTYDEISLLRSVRTKTSPLERAPLVLDVFTASILAKLHVSAIPQIRQHVPVLPMSLQPCPQS